MAATRFFGMDIHKRHVTVAAVDAQQQVVYEPKKVSIDHFPAWANLTLDATDRVAIEATINAWEFYDQLLLLMADVSVANCHQLRLISASAAKTDKHDALVLAKLLAANLLPSIWVPPQHVRELRNLTRHRSWLIHRRTALTNRLHALLHRHNLAPPPGGAFTASNETWWDNLPCSPV